jgi:hypothetical protein
MGWSDERMDYRRWLIAVVGVVAIFWWKGQFASMPKITRAAGSDTILVGEQTAPDHARFTVGEFGDLRGASVGYQFDSFGSGGAFLSNLGARGILSMMNAQAYAAAASYSCKTGQCMAGFLNQAESQGGIAHLILIPQDESALKQMKRVNLPAGARLRMTGHYLTYDSGTVDGQSFGGQLGNTLYFLVESISASE